MTTNQLVCIKRPEMNLSAVFEEMYLNERLVDVTLQATDGELQAHKLVLAACSPFFSRSFDRLPSPFYYPVITVDMRIDDLRLVVDFMYRGQLTISQERLMTLIKGAAYLQINGLSHVDGIVTSDVGSRDETLSNISARALHQRFKRGKKGLTSSLNHHHNQFGRAYQTTRQDELDSRLSPPPEKMLEQSMITGESIDNSHTGHQFSYSSNDPTSTRNLSQQLQTPSPSTMQLQHLPNVDQQQQQQQQLNNQLQVLSHSLAANRSSLNHSSTNGHQQSLQISQQQQQSRGRVHPCNICWKTFREKANLKRHLQVHSLDRVVYACPDCNKTFSWKDNYIRHTKTAHHMNNVRPQA